MKKKQEDSLIPLLEMNYCLYLFALVKKKTIILRDIISQVLFLACCIGLAMNVL